MELLNTNIGYLRNHSITIIKKNNFGNPINNKLAQNTCSICKEILEFTSNNFFKRRSIKKYSPTFLIKKISFLAYRINTVLQRLEDKQRKELLQYYHEWENISPIEFMSILIELMGLSCNRTDIQGALNSVERFIDMLLLLWSRLSQLEYVGQRRMNVIIIENPNIEKRYNLLD